MQIPDNIISESLYRATSNSYENLETTGFKNTKESAIDELIKAVKMKQYEKRSGG